MPFADVGQRDHELTSGMGQRCSKCRGMSQEFGEEPLPAMAFDNHPPAKYLHILASFDPLPRHRTVTG